MFTPPLWSLVFPPASFVTQETGPPKFQLRSASPSDMKSCFSSPLTAAVNPNGMNWHCAESQYQLLLGHLLAGMLAWSSHCTFQASGADLFFRFRLESSILVCPMRPMRTGVSSKPYIPGYVESIKSITHLHNRGQSISSVSIIQ
jgi:hypothetical protein